MRKGLIISILLHATILAIALIGLPHFGSRVIMEEQPLVVDLVDIGERTAAPPAAPEAPKDKPKPAPEPEKAKPEPPKPAPEPEKAKPEPPKPAPQPEPTPAPPPPPAPEPEPEPESEVAPEPPPEPEPAPEAEKKMPEPEVVKAAPPPKKPTPPKAPEPKKEPPRKAPPKKAEDDPFAALVKNVEKFRKQQATKSQEQSSQASPGSVAQGAKVRNAPFAERATMTERDHIRAQIERQWLIDAGAQGLEDMAIVLDIRIDPAGNVVDVRVASESWARYTTDPAFRAMAESARRAALKASPLDYPHTKYEIFKDMELVFRPQSRL